MSKWTGLDRPITAAIAEAEDDRLFDRPPRPMSPALRALFARLDTTTYEPWKKPKIQRGGRNE